MEKLTKLQTTFLKKVCFLLFLQLVLLLIVISVIHKYFPKKICFMTCRKWVDLLIYIVLSLLLIYLSFHRGIPITIRYMAFFGISALLAYILALQYNMISILNHNDKKTEKKFIQALLIVVSIFIVNLIVLPFTLRYMGFIYAVSSALFICLIGLIMWGLFVEKGFIAWVSISLIVFIGFLLTDLNIIVSNCRIQGSQGCDALNGASLLYIDLVNILQQIFILLNTEGNK